MKEELTKVRQERDALLNRANEGLTEVSKHYNHEGHLIDSYEALKSYLPPKVFEDIRQIFFGMKTDEIALNSATIEKAKNADVEVKHFRINAEKEENRDARIVRVAAIQNKIVLPTTEPVQKQKQAIMDRIQQIIEISVGEGANIIALQEIWNAPFFMCTRERYPCVEFA